LDADQLLGEVQGRGGVAFIISISLRIFAGALLAVENTASMGRVGSGEIP